MLRLEQCLNVTDLCNNSLKAWAALKETKWWQSGSERLLEWKGSNVSLQRTGGDSVGFRNDTFDFFGIAVLCSPAEDSTLLLIWGGCYNSFQAWQRWHELDSDKMHVLCPCILRFITPCVQRKKGTAYLRCKSSPWWCSRIQRLLIKSYS